VNSAEISRVPEVFARIVDAMLRGVRAWLGPERDAASRASLIAWSAIRVGALVVATVIIVTTVRPLTAPKPPAPLPPDGPDGKRFGLSLVDRKAIFASIAATEAHSRTLGHQGFPTEPWSAEDHRTAYERDVLRETAAQRGLNLTQAYLILDEGIRARWPGPDGEPLSATTLPLKPRRW
jgi:hypothetical protein